MDISNKLSRLEITGIVNSVFEPKKPLKQTRIKLYDTLAHPTLLYVSKSGRIKQEMQEG